MLISGSRITIKNIALGAIFSGAILGFHAKTVAQDVYRIVGPDGRVTFSDKPPVPSPDTKVTVGRGANATEVTNVGNPTLPLELRNIVQRFPVTLYTSRDCTPCETARNSLRSRGVPFSERTIESAQDNEALRRLSGSDSLPFATIGSQQLKGYSDVEWGQFLDAAGYPKTSQLPANYRNPPPAPLVVRTTPATAAAAPANAPAATAPATPAAPATAPSNPAGIRF
jgi:glutaredoxin